VYPDPRVAEFVTENFRPVRVHAVQQRDEFQRLGQRFNAQWTPTILVLDPGGVERHRIEGYLPVEEFLPQLELGLAKAAFARNNFEESERRFRAIVEKYPNPEAAPEALYWAGVSRYKATGDAKALADTATQFASRFTDTIWAKKASVWNK
jgi:thioredoxin family protein